MKNTYILGCKVDNVSLSQSLKFIKKFIISKKPHQICTLNPEYLMSAQDDEELKYIINNSSLNTADGSGLIFASKYIKKPVKYKVTGVQLSNEIFKLASKNNYRIFLLGGKNNVANELAQKLLKRYPKIKIVGTHEGFPHLKPISKKIWQSGYKNCKSMDVKISKLLNKTNLNILNNTNSDTKNKPNTLPNNQSSEPPKPSIGIKPSIDELIKKEEEKTKPKTYPETPPKSPVVDIKNKLPVSLIIKSIIITIIILILGYIIVNFSAIYLLFDYWYKVNMQNQKWSELHPIELVKAKTTAQKLDENYLYIPTLGIQAPVQWGIEEKDASNLLSTGLVHFIESASPDDATGNIYITGATSGPIWSSSAYKNIFTLLEKITPDNVITLIYKNNIYSYKIESINSTSNKNIIIAPGIELDDSYLNLLAKYPVGINWRTLIVKAKLFKIESNITQSIQDKVEELPEKYTDVKLDPIQVQPSTDTIKIPIDNKIPNPELMPYHFLPSI